MRQALATSLRRGGSAGRASVRLSIVWTLHANLNVTLFYTRLRLRVCDAERDLRADFVQLPTGGLLKEPLQSCDHRCGRFNFEVQCAATKGPLAPRGLGGRDLSSEKTPT